MATNARKSRQVERFAKLAVPPKTIMNRTGHRGRVDLNHSQIMNGLLQAGIRPKSTAMVGDGFADIVAGYRGVSILLEVKRYGEELTEAERKFAETWPGAYAVVYTPEQAINAVLSHAKECGKI